MASSFSSSFPSELNRIENELNSKCDKLIHTVLLHQKQMQSKLAALRRSYSQSEAGSASSRLKGNFSFDVEPILSAISSAIKLEILVADAPSPESHPPHQTEDFRLPKGLTVHGASGRIYVADMGNECVKVCGAAGNTLDTIGGGILREPHGLLLVSQVLYVTDTEQNSLLAFDVSEKSLLSRVGSKGGGGGEFCQPKGMALDQDEFVYVCDSGNNRVVIYTTKLEFIKPLSWEKIENPLNIAFSNNKMYLLCDANPCLFIMNSEGEQSARISSGYDCNVMPTGFFCVDSEERILMSCYGGVIFIFDKNCRMLGRHSVKGNSCFYGLSVNSVGKIVVVSTKPSAINFFDL